MRVKLLLTLFLLPFLISCNSAVLTTSPVTLTPTFTLSPRPTSTLTNTPQKTSTPTQNPTDFSTYYGTWTITRYEHYWMSAFLTDEYAESQIGKKMELTSTELQFDDDFLWLSSKHCTSASYSWATLDEFYGHGWQALLPSESPEKRDDLLFLDLYCDGKMVTGFEVSKTGKLVVYYDDYWFFLDPATTAASALATRYAITYTPSFTPTSLPKFTATFTATLPPTQYYEKYKFDWLIDQEYDTNKGNIVQAGSSPLFTSEEYPDTSDSYIDLDNSVYTEGISDLKFIFVKGTPPTYHLIPLNGTKLISVEFSHATLETCINAGYSNLLEFIAVESDKGNYFCGITSDKRFSLFHIDEVNHLGDGSLRMSFVTFKKDSDK